MQTKKDKKRINESQKERKNKKKREEKEKSNMRTKEEYSSLGCGESDSPF